MNIKEIASRLTTLNKIKDYQRTHAEEEYQSQWDKLEEVIYRLVGELKDLGIPTEITLCLVYFDIASIEEKGIKFNLA